METTMTMTKAEFNTKVSEVLERYAPEEVEDPKIQGLSVMRYAAWCEVNYVANLLARTGMRSKWTFYSDISIGEWFGIGSVVDTISRCFQSWLPNHEAIAELLLAINYKSWGMAERGLRHWCAFYADIYNALYWLVLDYYDANDKAAADYVASYLD